MNKSTETKSRRAAVLSVLGPGWKSEAGDGARDMYRARNGNRIACIQPERTVDGNYYVGTSFVRGLGGGFCYTKTINEAAEIAKAWLIN